MNIENSHKLPKMPPKRNPFFNFMTKRRSEMEGQGMSFPGGWREVAGAVNDEWAKMSDDEKKPFSLNRVMQPLSEVDVESETSSGGFHIIEDTPITSPNWGWSRRLASNKKAYSPMNAMAEFAIEEERQSGIDRNTSFSRKNTFGGSIDAYNSVHRSIVYYQAHLEHHVSRQLVKGSIPDMIFMLITFNLWCVTVEKKHIPSEVAIIAFSLRQGVIDQYSTIIDPKQIPSGLGYDAQVKADELYLPYPPFDTGCQQHKTILKNIVTFITKYQREPPGLLFNFRREHTATYSCLQWLCEQAGLDFAFELYPYEYLVTQLSKFAVTDAIFREEELTDIYSLPAELDSPISSTRAAFSERYSASGSSGATNYIKYELEEDEDLENCPIALEKCTDGSRNIISSEEVALRLVDRLTFGSLEFFGCLHHMIFSDAVHLCALSKLNRYAFHTMDILILGFGIKPVNGVNIIDMQITDSRVEMEKRREMLESWGLRSRNYDNYLTPKKREELRAKELANISAHCEDHPIVITTNPIEEKEDTPVEYVPPLFRKKDPLPEFIAMDPHNPYPTMTSATTTSQEPTSSRTSSCGLEDGLRKTLPEDVEDGENFERVQRQLSQEDVDDDDDDDGWSYAEA